MWDSPSQRPEHFTLNPYSPLREGLVFAGLGGGGCAQSLFYADSSGYEHNGSMIGMLPLTDWLWDSTLQRWGMTNFSTSKYITLSSMPLVSVEPFSLAAWLYIENIVQEHNYPAISISYTNWDRCDGIGTARRWVNNAWSYRVLARKFLTLIEYEYAVYSIIPQWMHVTCNFISDAKRDLYMNGVLVATDTTNVTNTANSGTYLGLEGTTKHRYFAGKLIDPLIYNRALTEAEIQQLADPSNHMLSGLILPPKRKYYRATTTSGTNLAAAVYYYQRMIAG